MLNFRDIPFGSIKAIEYARKLEKDCDKLQADLALAEKRLDKSLHFIDKISVQVISQEECDKKDIEDFYEELDLSGAYEYIVKVARQVKQEIEQMGRDKTSIKTIHRRII